MTRAVQFPAMAEGGRLIAFATDLLALGGGQVESSVVCVSQLEAGVNQCGLKGFKPHAFVDVDEHNSSPLRVYP